MARRVIDSYPEENAPPSTNWLSLALTYDGWGRAEFSDPAGTLEGPTTVRIDETGTMQIRMQVAQFQRVEPTPFQLIQFLMAGTYKQIAGGREWRLEGGWHTNPCQSLTVTSDTGIFSCPSDVPYSFNQGIGSKTEGANITFQPMRAQFDTKRSRDPAYWILPLLNLVTDFVANHPALDRHPLRLHEPNPESDAIRARDRHVRLTTLIPGNRLIIFDDHGRPGFIEPLHDYERRRISLQDRQRSFVVTAVCVGESGAEELDLGSFRDWFPLAYLSLLSFATGSTVGAPWVEIRDVSGELIRRIHVRANTAPYFRRRALISDHITSGGVRRLLSGAQDAEVLRDTDLEVWMRRLVRGGNPHLTLDERAAHLFVTLEGLYRSVGAARQPGPWDRLSQRGRSVVTRAVKALATNLNAEIAREEALGGGTDVGALRGIRQAFYEAKKLRPHVTFREKMLAILTAHGLEDAQVLDLIYAQGDSVTAQKTWVGAVKHYRDKITHEGYLDFRSGQYDAIELYHITQHLYDVIARVCLVRLGYQGTYQPGVIIDQDPRPPDWVKDTMTATDLGYEHG